MSNAISKNVGTRASGLERGVFTPLSANAKTLATVRAFADSSFTQR